MYMGAMVSVSLPVHVSLWFPARLHEALTQDTAFTALGKVLHLLNGILDGQVGAPGMGRGRPWSWGQGPYPGRAGWCRTTWILSRTTLRDEVTSSGSLSVLNYMLSDSKGKAVI